MITFGVGSSFEDNEKYRYFSMYYTSVFLS